MQFMFMCSDVIDLLSINVCVCVCLCWIPSTNKYIISFIFRCRTLKISRHKPFGN